MEENFTDPDPVEASVVRSDDLLFADLFVSVDVEVEHSHPPVPRH